MITCAFVRLYKSVSSFFFSIFLVSTLSNVGVVAVSVIGEESFATNNEAQLLRTKSSRKLKRSFRQKYPSNHKAYFRRNGQSKYFKSNKKKYLGNNGRGPNYNHMCRDICDVCDGGISSIQFRYTGSDNTQIFIQGSSGELYVPTKMVVPGDEINVRVRSKYSYFYNWHAGNKLDNVMYVYAHGQVVATVDTRCGSKIGPGIAFGDFLVEQVKNLRGNAICDRGERPTCGLCVSKVSEISFVYNGESESKVSVLNERWEVLFELERVSNGQQIHLGKSTVSLGRKLYLYVNNMLDTKMSLKCDEPSGSGAVWGSFTVLNSSSANSLPICPAFPTDCSTCTRGIFAFSIIYNNQESKEIEVFYSNGSSLFHDREVVENQIIDLNGLTPTSPRNYIRIKLGGEWQKKIYLDCKSSIMPGVVIGDFIVTSATTAENKKICGCNPIEPTQPTRKLDFGDAPQTYGKAIHVIDSADNPYIGDSPPDSDLSAVGGSDANGDDLSGADDEGFGFDTPSSDIPSTPLCNARLLPLTQYTVAVDVSGFGYLNAWIDWNGNGNFSDPSEHVAVNQRETDPGQIIMNITSAAATASTIARLRYSSIPDLNFDGEAPDGEVEDCALTVGF